MSVVLPELRVGDRFDFQALSVFPLFSDGDAGVAYRLSDAAMADKSLFVEEVSEGGSVPDLLVENKGDDRVLFVEGEELVGAKQNRILNTSVLVAAHSKIKVPVSCVEQGRWGYRSRYFGSSGSQCPSKLRRALKASVSSSINAQQGHRSDQAEVWKQVASLHEAHRVESGTAAMSDAFDTHQSHIDSYQDSLKYVENAVGVAAAIGGRIVSIDFFDKPSTCKQLWNRLLSGVVFDALEAGESDGLAQADGVEQLLDCLAGIEWLQTEAVGEGEEYRAESSRGDHASVLLFDQTVLHASVIAAC